MTKTFYTLECTANNCQAEFYVNDIPVVLRGGHKGHFFGGPVNQYLVDGDNEFAMVIAPGPKPSEAKTGPGGVKTPTRPAGNASVILSRYPHGSVLGGPDRDEIARLEWPDEQDEETDDTPTDEEDGQEPTLYPLEIKRSVDLGKMFGRWEWQGAPRLSLDDATRDSVGKLLKELHGSILDGDPEPFIRLSAVRLTELARAYDSSPGEKAAIVRVGMKQDAAKNWWDMEPLEKKKFDLRLCAGDRMIDCVATDWEPIVREVEDDEGGRGYYNMTLSKIGGAWQIVR